jgi:hypothetical protein
MTFITKAQAEQFLREYYADNGYAEDGETFEEVVEGLGDMLDCVTPNVVYAYHVFVGNV